MTASASAISPASWPDSPGASAEVSETGSALRCPPCWWPPAADAAGAEDGTIAGNRPAALPAPISELDTPLRFGMGPSGSDVSGEAPADLAGAAAVTVTVSAAAGGVHFAAVAMLAVAVSLTEVTDVAVDATAICACRVAGCFSDTEPTLQVAVPSPFAQPLVNVGFWLDGWAAMATDTLLADPPFSVETCTTKAAAWPRGTLDWERWTLTHSSGCAALLVALALEPALVCPLAVGLEAM